MRPQEFERARSDQVLRTLASVPVSSSILDLGCGAGQHTEAFLRLGFPVHACDPRPEAVRRTRLRVRDLVDQETATSCVRETTLEGLDTLDETFNWVVAVRPEVFIDSAGDLPSLLEASLSLLEPGGWLYLAAPATLEEQRAPTETPPTHDDVEISFSASELEASQLDVALREAQSPSRVEENDRIRIHALYRRVGPQTRR